MTAAAQSTNASAYTAEARPSNVRIWLTVMGVSLGESRQALTIPIYVLLGIVALLPLGMLMFLLNKFYLYQSGFQSFFGDLLSSPQGYPQRLAGWFYIYLYLIGYLSMASVIGYEVRRDRSIMFWKSLPISDAMWVVGQISALFVSYLIGLAVLALVDTVITVWEYLYYTGLKHPFVTFWPYYAEVMWELARFAVYGLLILYLSLPFGVSMLWFATFTKRQPSSYWLGTFVSIYLICFALRFIGFEIGDPVLWYPEGFIFIARGLLFHDGHLSEMARESLPLMCVVSAVLTGLFGFLTWRSRRYAVPL